MINKLCERELTRWK